MASSEGMDKQNFNETDEPSKCFHAFKTMRERNEFTDVVLVCDGGEVAAHQMVLAVRSEYFRKMFLSNFKESTTKKVEFPDINKDTLLLVLDYIYFNSIENTSDQNVENLIEIYKVSHLFEISGLSKSCWNLIINRINAENWWELVLLHGNNEGTVKILQFIVDNLSEIVKRNRFVLNYSQLMTMLKKINEYNLPVEEKFLEAIIQWKKKTKEENVDLLPIFLELKFDFISKEFVNNLLEKENDLFDEILRKFLKRYVLPNLNSEIEIPKKTFLSAMTDYKNFPIKFFCFNFCIKKTNEDFLDRNASVTIFDCEKKSEPKLLDNLPFRNGYGIYPVQYGSDIYIVGGTPNGVPEVTHSGVKYFFLYDWKKNEIVVKPSLIYEVQLPVTCVTEDNIYVVGSVYEQGHRKTIIQYFSIIENKWFAKIHSFIARTIACASIKDVTYLLCLTGKKLHGLYTVKQLNLNFHSNIPVQKSSHFYQRSVTAHKGKIFLLTEEYQLCIFHHHSQHWTVGSFCNPPSVHLFYIHIFSNANNYLMLYNEKEQSLYQFDENNSDIKKVMTLKENDCFDSKGYSKFIKWFFFQS